MPNYINESFRKEIKPHFESLRDDINRRKDPTFFWPTGTQVYCGLQGSGKTISAVAHALRLKKRYPGCILVTNLSITGMEPLTPSAQEPLDSVLARIDTVRQYVKFDTLDELAVVLTGVNNGFKGVLYLIDEIHSYFNALDSKNIPPYIFTEISQQRKQRKCIIGTSQLFLRLAKPFREQCDSLIMCKTYAGFITRQTAFDGATLSQDYQGNLHGDKKKTGWFFHTRKLRDSFDTYQKIVSGSVQFEEMQYKSNDPVKVKAVGGRF